jgi:hypothetical protein
VTAANGTSSTLSTSDLTETDPVAAALPDPWPRPQSDRERDVPGRNVLAQLAAELHTRDASGRGEPRAGAARPAARQRVLTDAGCSRGIDDAEPPSGAQRADGSSTGPRSAPGLVRVMTESWSNIRVHGADDLSECHEAVTGTRAT